MASGHPGQSGLSKQRKPSDARKREGALKRSRQSVTYGDRLVCAAGGYILTDLVMHENWFEFSKNGGKQPAPYSSPECLHPPRLCSHSSQRANSASPLCSGARSPGPAAGLTVDRPGGGVVKPEGRQARGEPRGHSSPRQHTQATCPGSRRSAGKGSSVSFPPLAQRRRLWTGAGTGSPEEAEAQSGCGVERPGSERRPGGSVRCG